MDGVHAFDEGGARFEVTVVVGVGEGDDVSEAWARDVEAAEVVKFHEAGVIDGVGGDGNFVAFADDEEIHLGRKRNSAGEWDG